MKTMFKSLAMIAVAALSFAACTQKEEVIPSEGQMINLKFNIKPADDAMTRALLGTENGMKFLAWENGDQIGTFSTGSFGDNNESKNNPGTVEVTNDGYSLNVQTFNTGTITNIYSYFPFSGSAGKNKDAAIMTIPESQIMNAMGFDADAMPMAGTPVEVDLSITQANHDTPCGTIYFDNLGALINFKIFSSEETTETLTSVKYITSGDLGGAFTIDLTAIDASDETTLALTASNTVSAITTTYTTHPAIPVGKAYALDVFMVVAPGTYENTQVVVTTSAHTYTLNASGAKTYTRSHVKPMTVDIQNGTQGELPVEENWVKVTSAADFTEGTYYILRADGAYYVPNAVYTASNGPSVVAYSAGAEISSAMKWTATTSDTGLKFESSANSGYYLGSSNTGQASSIRVNSSFTGNNASTVWTFAEVTVKVNNENITYYTATCGGNRYLASNGGTDWRYYGTSNINANNIPAEFYKLTVVDNTPRIEVNPESIEAVSYKGGDYSDLSYELKNMTGETAEITCDGIIVTEAVDIYGAVLFTVSPNDSEDERDGWIKIAAGGLEVEVPVRQAGKPSAEIILNGLTDGKIVLGPNEGDVATFVVHSNYAWYLVSEYNDGFDETFYQDPTEGNPDDVESDDSTVTVEAYEANEGTEDRLLGTILIYNANGDSVLASIEVWQSAPTSGPTGWIETPLADITDSDVFVIVGNDGEDTYALPNEGVNSAPLVVAVTVSGEKLIGDVSDNIKWTLSGNATNGYTFYPNGSTATWLYCNTTAASSSNNNIRVGTGDRKVFILDSHGYLVTNDDYTDRYLSFYVNSGTTQDWRGYVNTNSAPVIKFYKYFDAPDTREEAGMQWSAESATATMTDQGVEFTAPTLTPGHAHDVTYNSTNTEVATIGSDGTVEIVAEGTTTIQAIFAGDEDYKPATVGYTLTVEDNRTPAASFTNIAELNALAEGSTPVEYSGTLTNAVVSYVPDTGNAIIKDATGSILLYKSDHGLLQGQTFSGNVTVSIQLYNGCSELTACDATFTGTQTVIEPQTVTLSALVGHLTEYQNAYVKVENLQVVSVSSKTVNVTDGTNTYVVYSSAANATCVSGDIIRVIGTIAHFGENDQIKVWKANDITVTSHIVASHAITFTQPTGAAADAGCSFTVSVGGNPITSGASIEEGTTVTLTATEGTGYTFSGWTVIGANVSGNTTPATFVVGTSDVSISANFQDNSSTSVIDVLDPTAFGNPSSYSNWSGKTGTSGAVYAGNSSGGNSYFQIRSSNNNSGIVTTTSGGYARKVTITWDSSTDNARVLQVYGKHTSYSTASDLYNNNTQGTLLGTIAKNGSNVFTINGDYEYIGLRSASGAMYITEIQIEWSTSGGGNPPAPETYSVSWTTPSQTGCSISATVNSSAISSGDEFEEGTVVTITATPGSGFTFGGWTLTGATPANASSATTTFTIGTSDVTIAATFTPTGSGDSIVYTKVTSESDLTSGTYLIVYESGNLAFNGGLTTLDGSNNSISVSISSNSIAQSAEVDAASFTYDADNGTFKSASNYYIGRTANSNGLDSSETTAYTNTVSFNNDGTTNIVSGGAYLRYNKTAGQERFRYFKSSSYSQQQAICLYKRSE